MHYGKTAFSKNGQPTIVAITDPNKRFGQRNGASTLDIVEINAVYNCPPCKYILFKLTQENVLVLLETEQAT